MNRRHFFAALLLPLITKPEPAVQFPQAVGKTLSVAYRIDPQAIDLSKPGRMIVMPRGWTLECISLDLPETMRRRPAIVYR